MTGKLSKVTDRAPGQGLKPVSFGHPAALPTLGLEQLSPPLASNLGLGQSCGDFYNIVGVGRLTASEVRA